MTEVVLFEVRDNVAILTLNRPEKPIFAAINGACASMATMKRQVYPDYARARRRARRANRLMAESFTAPDLAEGVQSFLERRPPRLASLPR